MIGMVIMYLVFAVITSATVKLKSDMDAEDLILFGLLWPVLVPICLFFSLYILCVKQVIGLVEKIKVWFKKIIKHGIQYTDLYYP